LIHSSDWCNPKPEAPLRVFFRPGFAQANKQRAFTGESGGERLSLSVGVLLGTDSPHKGKTMKKLSGMPYFAACVIIYGVFHLMGSVASAVSDCILLGVIFVMLLDKE